MSSIGQAQVNRLLGSGNTNADRQEIKRLTIALLDPDLINKIKNSTPEKPNPEFKDLVLKLSNPTIARRVSKTLDKVSTKAIEELKAQDPQKTNKEIQQEIQQEINQFKFINAYSKKLETLSLKNIKNKPIPFKGKGIGWDGVGRAKLNESLGDPFKWYLDSYQNKHTDEGLKRILTAKLHLKKSEESGDQLFDLFKKAEEEEHGFIHDFSNDELNTFVEAVDTYDGLVDEINPFLSMASNAQKAINIIDDFGNERFEEGFGKIAETAVDMTVGTKVKVTGTVLGLQGGVSAGAAIGTAICPGPGTAAGAFIGGVAGALGGNVAAKKGYNATKKFVKEECVVM